jgi:outer membrane receptor protein involved in Fe transport
MVNEARRVFAGRPAGVWTLLMGLLFLGPAAPAIGQTDGVTATLGGLVRDESGAVLDAARVTVANLDTGMQREVVSGSDGQFAVPLLPAGLYKVTVLRDGFSPGEVGPVAIKAGDRLALQIQLKIDVAGETVMVTAQKRGEERLRDVPVPIAVLDAERLATHSQVLLRDYAATVPGFTVTPNYVGRQNLSLRGIAAVSLENPTVGVTIDDMPFGSSTDNGSSVPDLDPADLARIEVLRGPQGTLYGANGMGGLLRYVTQDPSTAGVSGRVEIGATGLANGDGAGLTFRGALNLPLSDTAAVRVSGFRRKDPGYIDNSLLGLRAVNDARVFGGRVAALWKLPRESSIKVGALYQRSEWDGLDEVDPALGDLRQNYIRDAGKGQRAVQAYGGTFTTKIGAAVLTSVTGYTVNDLKHSLDISFAFASLVEEPFGTTGILYAAPKETTTKFTQEARLNGTVGTRLEWLVGGFYTHERGKYAAFMDVQDPISGQKAGRYYTSESGRLFDEVAAFGAVTYHFSPRFDLQVGGRQSHDRIGNPEGITTGLYAAELLGADPSINPVLRATGNVFTYLVTPRFTISRDVMVYARFASGYRPGGPNVEPIPQIPASFEADTTRNYEVGLKRSFLGQRLFVDASLYLIDWNNLQFQARYLPTQTPYIDNGSAARSAGVELALAVRPRSGTTIDVSTSYDDAVLSEDFPGEASARGVKGDRIPLSTRWSSHVALEQEFPLWPGATGFAGGSVTYAGDRVGPFTEGARELFPAYTQANLRAGVRLATWTVSAFVNNVTNERGVLDGGLGYFYPPARIYIKPRAVGMALAKTF